MRRTLFSVVIVASLSNGFILDITGTPHTHLVKPTPSSSVEGHYRFAAVASDTQICSTIGTEIMARKGSTAVDAAIATLLCVGVANAMSTGIGGGHFMTIYKRDTGKVHTIIAREMAPAAANSTMFLDLNTSSQEGGLAVGIPGELMGMWEAHKLGGRVPWVELLEPTIKLCEEGVPVSPVLAGAMATMQIRGTLNKFIGLKTLVTNPATNRVYRAGEKMLRPKLAKTLRIVAREGIAAFYNGSLSGVIAREIQLAGGIVSVNDLKGYNVKLKDPLMITLNNNMTVYSPPPPSSGAVFQYILNILDGYKFTSRDVASPDAAILTYHRIVEAFKFAYAKRSALGDGDGEGALFRHNLDLLLANMTSKAFAEDIRRQITDQATHSFRYYGPVYQEEEDHGTAHLSVLGPNGDAVSVTSTENLLFGSKVVGQETGIVYNDEMDDFSTPNTTNFFGVPASVANFIKPGKRPLSSVCPSIILDQDGHVVLVVGASGGTKITTATALVAIDTLWFNMGIKQAIDYPRIHHQLLPAQLVIENGFPQIYIDGLKQKGHNVTLINLAGSNVQGILQRKEEDIYANSDFRKLGIPDGY